MLNSIPANIEKVNDDALRIAWQDGHTSEYGFRYLRQHCPCAVCKDEWTGAQLLDPKTVPPDLKATGADVVGNYALSFVFSDSHGSGIYSFEKLRQLCPCKDCAK